MFGKPGPLTPANRVPLLWRERFDEGCQAGVWVLTVALLIYATLAWGATPPGHFLVLRWLVVGLLVLWVLRLALVPGASLHLPLPAWFFLGFLAYGLVRYLTADVTYVAREEWIRVLVYAVVFLAVVNHLRQPMQVRRLVLVVVGVAALVSCYAIFQYATGSEFIWNLAKPEQYALRGSGTYINPNHLAGFLAMVFPAGLALVVWGRFRPVGIIGLGYLVLLLGAGLYVTVSRGGWLAAGIGLGCLLFWWAWRGRRWITGSVLLAVMVLVPLLFIAKSKVTQDRVQGTGWTGQIQDMRWLLWRAGYAMWRDHWLAGVGPAHFDVRFPQYRPAHRDVQVRPGRVHNDYLNLLVDWGILGAVLMGGVWVGFGWRLAQTARGIDRAGDEPVHYQASPFSLLTGLTSGLGAVLFHSLFDFNLHVPANALVAVVWMGLVTGMFRLGGAREGRVCSRALRWGLIGLLGAAGVYLVWANVRLGRELGHLAAAKEADARDFEGMVAAFKAATEAEPLNPRTYRLLGDLYRQRSWQGLEGYEADARTAIGYYKQAAALNPYDSYPVLGHGMCLDWLGQPEKGEELMLKAHRLDPHGYDTTAMVGWHYLAAEKYAESKRWLERSIELFSNNNFLAWYYLQRVKERLADQEKWQKTAIPE